ncbi:MAG TPA: zinc ribbon domain-containing protein [Planctomycetota bacterium]|nr:zinc ribbon domain-containing protein [Planctomycetota bacterium]
MTKAMPPVCQSCAMPMEEPRQLGTEAGGAPNAEYCCYCYQQGRFTAELSLKQMQDKLIALALERKFMPEAEARKLAGTVLPKLKRWRSQ